MLLTFAIAALLGSFALGGVEQQSPDKLLKSHYPRLTHAEMPLYPPLARAAHVSGRVEVKVTVERGSVVEVLVKSSSSPLLANPTVATVKTWQFESEDRATFLVTFVYEIKGKRTSLPENPQLELNLPWFVKIRARPYKPTRT